jgi:hypothetical protein
MVFPGHAARDLFLSDRHFYLPAPRRQGNIRGIPQDRHQTCAADRPARPVCKNLREKIQPTPFSFFRSPSREIRFSVHEMWGSPHETAMNRKNEFKSLSQSNLQA